MKTRLVKIYVNQGKKKSGGNSQKMIVWAAFMLQSDANKFYYDLKRDNPTWTIIID